MFCLPLDFDCLIIPLGVVDAFLIWNPMSSRGTDGCHLMLPSFINNQKWDINLINLGGICVCDTNHGIGGQLGKEELHVLLESLTKSQFDIGILSF